MSKSLAFDFIGLYSAILRDVQSVFPNDSVEWERDLHNLTRLYQNRGQAVFTIDLPALGKALDKSLSQGRLCLDGMNLSGSRYPGSKIPRLFWGLWSRLFDEEGLKSDIDPNVVLFLRTLLCAGKKLKWECSPRYLFEATGEFYAIEKNMPPPSHYWDSDGDSSLRSRDDHLGDLLGESIGEGMFRKERTPLVDMLASVQQAADRISTILGEFSPSEWKFRHGPGAVSDLRSGLYKYEFPEWSPRLDRLFPIDEYGLSTGLGVMEKLGPDGLCVPSREGASKLIAVPKSQKGPRLIAAEPTCHQWVQQCIRDFVYTRVSKSVLGLSVRFNDQTANQELARSGSLSGDYATIDLKSASDRLSCHVVQRIFRRNPFLLDSMVACRTRWISNTIDSKQPSLHKLRKFSTQGSALTFPIQTLVFLAAAVGTGMYLEPKRKFKDLLRDVRVFGDDIIVPTTWKEALVQVLTALGLVVNQTKTFSEGNFRESCGMDAWRGYDVTPPGVTTMPDKSDPVSVASNVAVSNNFFTKGFWHAADWLVDRLPKEIIVVGSRSGVFGLKSFAGAPIPSRTRWNRELHRDDARALVVVAKATRARQDTASALLQFFTEEPEPHIDYESGVAVAGVPVFKHAWVPVADIG
ncbi:MAG: putative replicase protein [Gulmivirus nemorishabitans]|uniref:RNA-directed RNA polymerase n=1 Tax=Leviviridae sp. TaxID=2027243 RepID=A0ABY3SU19_9VIRU|nr:MAG: putative replicase protein [Leviviridae sp.]